MTNQVDKVLCPYCCGDGVDPYPEPICCGAPDRDGYCCGSPEPDWRPCGCCLGSGWIGEQE